MSAAVAHDHDPTSTLLDWLGALYDNVETGWLTLFALDRTTGDRYVEWHPVDDYDALTDAALRLAGSCCVWWGVATRTDDAHDRPPRERGRGGADDCAAVPGLWVDIDIDGPGHKGGHPLPADVDEARRLLDDFPVPPTAVVATGGGLQAWWLFAEPEPADQLAPILARWGHTWAELGRNYDWHVDNVFDVARIMRLPGTYNRKTDPVPVEVVDVDWARRYGLDDLNQWLEELPEPPEPAAAPTADRVPYIGPERPGDAFNATHDGSGILSAAGWTLHHRDRNGDEHWTRPGKDRRQGASATVYADDGHTTIWSDSVRAGHPSIELRRPYDPFGLYTHLCHAGDWRAASDTLVAQGYGSKSRQGDDLSWIGAGDAPAAASSTGEAPSGPQGEPTSLVDRLGAAILTSAAIRALPPPSWLIDDYLTRDSLALLYGPSGAHKTFLGIDWALHVATGSHWNGHAIERPGRVLYVIAEGVSGVGARLDAWQQHHRIYDLDGHAPIAWLPRAVNLSDRVEAAALAEIVARHAPDLVVIDTLARCSVGAEENSARDMGVVVDHLDLVRRASGACVLTIHHTGKDQSNGARGSSALQAAMDTNHEIVPGDERLTLKVTKQKDAPEANPLPLARLPVQAAGSVVLVPSRIVATSEEHVTAGAAAALDALRGIAVPGGIPTTVWGEAAEVPRTSFMRYRRQLVERGLVRNVGTDSMPRYVPADLDDETTA